MNLAGLHRKLIAAARATVPSERVPYAFVKRIMARLTAKPVFDAWTLWGRALWRAAASCVALVLLVGAWSLLTPAGNGISADLSQALETTLLASFDQPQD